MARSSRDADRTEDVRRAPLGDWFRQQVLWPEETLLWAGRPGILRSAFFNFWFFPIGALLCVILFLIWWGSETTGALRLPELVLIFGAMWLATSPLRYGWRAGRTAYFITDRRVVLLQKGLFRIHQMDLDPARITDCRIRRASGDRGDIRLRLSRTAAANPYQEDKLKWMPEESRRLIAWTGSAPFALYTDGLWGIDDLSLAVAAIERLRRTAAS